MSKSNAQKAFFSITFPGGKFSSKDGYQNLSNLYIAEFFSVSSYSSEAAYSDLDVRITYEATKGEDASLGTILQIEQALMTSSMIERKRSLLPRILELKYSVLATESDEV